MRNPFLDGKKILRQIPGAILLYKKIRALYTIKVTAIGTCFCNFTFLELNKKLPITLINHLWARSDGALDLLNGIKPDSGLIKYYLSQGYWNLKGSEAGHHKEILQTILSWYKKDIDIRKDRPNILLLDSLYEQRHQFHQHRRDKWKAFFGKLYFDSSNLSNSFASDFEFIGRIDPMQTLENVSKICKYFKSRNPNIKIFYMHFPIQPDYTEYEIIERDSQIKDAISKLQIENFFSLSIPMDKVQCPTDPAHPNYAPQIWAHFYSEVYEYFADMIIDIISPTFNITPSGSVQ